MPVRNLYGGAIQCGIPSDWVDLATTRQIPDHQECFMYHPSHSEPYLLVVEIVQHQSLEDRHAAAYFFQDLADSNGCAGERFQNTENLPACTNGTVVGGSGVQRVKIHTSTNPPTGTRVDLCVFRFPSYDTDIIITLSTPMASDIDYSEPLVWRSIISSFSIRDWNLFSG